MIEWLTDTLLATGALMALVLVLRRPVARWFGAGAAYALWALPMIRLVLPPLALPRGLLPSIEIGLEPLTAAAAGPRLDASAQIAASASSPPEFAALPAAADVSVAAPLEPSLLEQVPWTSAALTIWLAGAILFLVWRTVTYRWMRRDLLKEARLVAHSGAVRIVETPAINAPLAFGVRDKVVALPLGFLAEVDSETSDFAIAHELEHHAGGDLLALIAMQPLFALHWFNPLGWSAWRAVRGDQEASCDARVMAGRSRAERASYGRLIASLAGGTRLALAAPMAGPLSGDKPIIHRLKALARKDVTPARRVLARSLFAMAVVTVPATATVSYAAMDEADGPATEPSLPAVPSAPPVPPVPSPPAEAPEAPEPPEAPQAPDGTGFAVPPAPPAPPAVPAKSARPTTAFRGTYDREAQDAERQAAEAERRAADAADRAAHAERRAVDALAHAPRVEETVSADGRRRTISISRRDAAGGTVLQKRMVIDPDCPADSQRRETRAEAKGAGATVVVCTGEPRAAKQAAVNAIRMARASISANRVLDAKVRAEIIADLDREIADAQREAQGS